MSIQRLLRAFLVFVDQEGCCDYGFDAYEEEDYWDFRQRTFIGHPLPRTWRLPKHSLGSNRLPLRDFIMGYTEAPFVSRRVRDNLMCQISTDAEFRSIGKLRGIEYFVMNVINLVDCLNRERSTIRWSRETRSRIVAVDQFAFHTDRIPNAFLFKVPEDTGKIFGTERFVDLVRAHRFTGVGFEDPGNIGLSKINRVFNDLPLR